MKQAVRFEDLGQLDYSAAWDYQTGIHRALVDVKLAHRNAPPGSYTQAHHLLFVEHPPVYTLGKSGTMDHLLLTEPELKARGIAYFPVNRGGDITYHGPGQIVGYPILDLECFFTDVHRYVRSLEEVMIRMLAEYGIEGYRVEGYTGVWVKGQPAHAATNSPFWAQQRKICAIGVHLSRWVTLHGFALNVNTPLAYFNYIVPCGIADPDKTVTNMQTETGAAVALPAVQSALKRHFAAVFDCELVENLFTVR
jgi:lipoyl(octanoyl) transferase